MLDMNHLEVIDQLPDPDETPRGVLHLKGPSGNTYVFYKHTGVCFDGSNRTAWLYEGLLHDVCTDIRSMR